MIAIPLKSGPKRFMFFSKLNEKAKRVKYCIKAPTEKEIIMETNYTSYISECKDKDLIDSTNLDSLSLMEQIKDRIKLKDLNICVHP